MPATTKEQAVAAAKRAQAAALRATADALELEAAALEAEPPEPACGAVAGLATKQQAARELGVSLATLDWLVRDGAPVHLVGTRRRFDLSELRTWLDARGRRAAPARAPRDVEPDLDVTDLAARAGLVRRAS